MRKIFLSLLIGLSLSVYAAETPWGIADTIDDYQVGPGIRYLKIHYPQHPLLMWVTEIDLTNPYNMIEQVQSNDKVPDVLRENVSSMSRRNSYPGHQVCAAFNHDFFSYDQGICIGLNVSKGEITQRHSDGRSIFAITQDKKAHVFHPRLDSRVILPDQTSVVIDNYNWWALAHYGDCVLFNRFNSLQLSDEGTYIQFKAIDPWVVNGASPITCEVLSVSDIPIQPSNDKYVLFARNGKEKTLSTLKPGDIISVEQKFITGKFGVAPQDIVNAFHGYPSIAYEGKLHEGEYNDFENGREYEKSSRLMAGMSQDGTKVFLYATELSSASLGIDCVELATFMLAHGCWNVVNFDSGGSVAVVIDHTMQNLPGRGSIRPVADGVLCVSTSPEEKTISHYKSRNSSLTLPAASLSALQIMGYNQYGSLQEKNCTGFKFKCVPEKLGYVDNDLVFHASFAKMNGKIIGEKAGKYVEIDVKLQNVDNISVKDTVILLDRIRQYPLHIVGLSSGIERILDAQAFSWYNSNPECCVVEKGVIKGLSNGEAIITGTLGDVSLSVKVRVETNVKEMIVETFNNMNSFKITSSAAIKNLSYSVPAEWGDGIKIAFDLVSGRLPGLTMEKPIRLYGIPDSLMMNIEVPDDLINTFIVDFENQYGELIYQYKPKLVKGLNHLVVSFTGEENLIDISQYPLSLSRIYFGLKSGARDQQTISISPLKTYYPEANLTTLENISKQDLNIRLSQNNNEIGIYGESENSATLKCRLYGVNGLIYIDQTQQVSAGSFSSVLQVDILPKGVYLLEIQLNHKRQIFKIAR